jgi:hypothetical protein
MAVTYMQNIFRSTYYLFTEVISKNFYMETSSRPIRYAIFENCRLICNFEKDLVSLLVKMSEEHLRFFTRIHSLHLSEKKGRQTTPSKAA